MIKTQVWMEADPEFPHYYKNGYDWRRDGKIYTSETIAEAKRKAAELVRSDINHMNDTPESMRWYRATVWRYTGKWIPHDTVGGKLYTRDYDRVGILQLQVI